jgi:hypothetical protein
MRVASNTTRVSYLGEMSINKALEAISKEDKAASFDASGFFCFGGQTGRWTGEIKEANICSFLVGGCWGDTRKF